jgi:hypothetical protein
MRYDLMVIGAGPAELTAAKSATQAGLKVILFERKKEITEVGRHCGQFTNISLINVSGPIKYGYTEPLALDIAYGYMATRITVKEMQGKSGYREYCTWWQKDCDTNDPEYLKSAGRNSFINLLSDDAEIDYLFQLIGNEVGVPAILIANHMDDIRREKPVIWEKLTRVGFGADLSGQKIDLADILQGKAGSRPANQYDWK